ncbi:Scr1 family TA system antitoxin-like transcriptional regulator [Spirillospora sp. NPDC048832]
MASPRPFSAVSDGGLRLGRSGDGAQHSRSGIPSCSAQLRYLIHLAEVDRVCVRVVPRTSGWQSGHDGHFQVMTINGRGVSYAVAQVAGRLIEAGDESSLLEVRFDEIGAVALPWTDSQTLMKEILRPYE